MTWPPSDYPVAVNKANATTSTTDHPAHHNALGNVANDTVALITDYIAALGNVTASGYQSQPTFFPSTSTTWSDGGWIGAQLGTNSSVWAWGVLNGKTNLSVAAVDDGVSSRVAQNDFYAESDAGTEYVDFFIKSSIGYGGTGHDGRFILDSDLATFSVRLTDAHLTWTMDGVSGQTDPLVDLESGMFAIAPDGSVGGVAPSVGDSIKWDGTKWKASA